ncbi:terpenoid synthase [Dendrothele bispora CBS 962.96]|uniref:Terpene synthase n=1 Tax=Dendrothele bispora (strain CBS 962.96) TaxID=1314807 RepID=A0A4V4HB85_DENBC|nr:terpenoid synthase [Dendrothele bispora CBS 962.96]
MLAKNQKVDRFFIPDTLAYWPWSRHLNPAYGEQKALSSAWLRSFNAFDEKSQKAFDLCDFSRFARIIGLSSCGSPRLRSGCDLMNCFFIFDEYSDVADPDVVRKQADIIMDAIRNPHNPRPSGEFIGGEVHRQFWVLVSKGASPTAQRRFINTYQQYVDSVVQQAVDRANDHIRDIEGYFRVRRDTIGAKPSFTLLEFTMDIPDEVMNHPVVQDLTIWCIDMLIIGNDICSYNVEQAQGDDLHNLVTIVMNQYDLDLPEAMKWIGEFHDSIAEKFLSTYKNLPDWGPYVDGLGNWVCANDSWSFESWRYFRGKGLEIEKTRSVELMPQEKATITPKSDQTVPKGQKNVSAIALFSVALVKLAVGIIPAYGLYMIIQRFGY